jgi:indole-3-glycerol phosphate synthase
MIAGHEAASADLLETILAATRRIVELRATREPPADLARRAEARPARPGCFRAALARGDRVNVIAECKRRSPSRGVLRADYDAAAIARAYVRGGAVAVSVLTEPTFFDGSLAHLGCVCEAVEVPVLRKDFIVTEYQLFEARAAGADAVLLIAAALAPGTLQELMRRAAALEMDALVEVHDARELAVAIDAGAQIVGVNNRNLHTLQVDVGVSDALAKALPAGVLAVSESGLKTAADVQRLRAAGYNAFLIGERFMQEDDPEQAVRRLLGGGAEVQPAVRT